MKTRTIIDPDTGKRRDKTEYPVDAIREAVLNAVIHRDYSIHTEGKPLFRNSDNSQKDAGAWSSRTDI